MQLPFLPHWRVPEFLRGCLAVCCLEQGFQITFHTPIIPREVLFISSNPWDACGAKSFGLNVAWIERVTGEAMALLCVESETLAPLTMFKALRTQMDELGVEVDHRVHSLSELPRVVASYEP